MNQFPITKPADFGKMYSGSNKARHMKRNKCNLLDTQLKPNILKHDRQTKYNRIRL